MARKYVQVSATFDKVEQMEAVAQTMRAMGYTPKCNDFNYTVRVDEIVQDEEVEQLIRWFDSQPEHSITISPCLS